MKIHNNQKGFAMPTVIFMIVIMSIVAYAALVQSNNVLNLTFKQAYIQMARVAAKSGVNYAKEQFDQNASYSGTTEQTLISNSRYRVTYKVDVLATSADGLEKTVKGTGSVYLPTLSTTAKYVFDVRSEIVRTYAIAKQPTDFANLALWLDSSKANSMFKTTSSTATITPTPTTTFGSASNSSRDTLEELESNGTQTANSWQSADLEMSYCDRNEFSTSTCNGSSTRRQYVGMIFQNVTVPKNATIISANIEMVGGTPSGTSGAVTHRYCGIYKTNGNPHPDLFTSSGSNQIKSKLTNATLKTSTCVDDTSNNFPPGNTRQVDITAVTQEIVNNAGWTNGGNMGFGVQYVSGSGVRRATKDGLKLNLTYSTSGSTVQAGNNDSLTIWQDARANGLQAVSTHGTAPVKIDNQINGQPIVRFNNGDMLAALGTALTGNEFTMLAVVKPNFNTSTNSGRFLSAMNSSQTSDTVNQYAFQALRRSGSSSGLASQYDGTSSNSTSFNCGGAVACSDTTIAVASVFQKNSNNSVTGTLRANGSQQNTTTFTPSPSNSSYTINELWVGGNRSGSGTGSGVNYMNGDYAEIILYNGRLTCQQIFGLEEYLRSKWAVSGSQWTNTCPEDNVPVL